MQALYMPTVSTDYSAQLNRVFRCRDLPGLQAKCTTLLSYDINMIATRRSAIKK